MKKISELRSAGRNPYAYIEYLEDPEIGLSVQSDVQRTRILLQNPYAFSDQPDVAQNPRVSIPSQTRQTGYKVVENVATKLQRNLWIKMKKELGTLDPLDVLDPENAFEYLGYRIFLSDDLGRFKTGQEILETAGMINPSRKEVHLSKRYPPAVRRFTCAHELGHAMLKHSLNGVIHRDRPVTGVSIPRNSIEKDADKFATFFLMPEKLVRSRFIESFGMAQMTLNENNAFGISCLSLHALRQQCSTSRDFVLLVASSSSFFGRNFPSLAEQFQVSPLAMAIRLEELNLVNV